MMMPEIGTEVNMTYDQFKEMNIVLFARHGNLEIDVYAEMDREMHLVYLNPFQNTLEMFTSDKLNDVKADDEYLIHLSTWQDGKGWIVDYSMTRKLLMFAAHTYENPQPCINCDVYKENVEKMGEDHWAKHKTCQDCITGQAWPNFTMEIEEE